MLTLENNKPGKPLILNDEPIYLGDKIIGRTTSGNYSFNFKKNLAFGYVKKAFFENKFSKSEIFIEIEKIKYPAQFIKKPLKSNNYKNL